MKNINFIRAGMCNFSCYTNLVDFPFLNDKIVLITGPNGSGKTTIYDSVPFTLYGETTKGTKSTDVINNVVGKNCHTFVEFTVEVDNEIEKYRVDRYVKDSRFSDTVLIYKNDNPKPYKKGQKEVLPEIERLLVPQKLFINTLLFGQKVKDFFTDLTDNEKKDIFRKVLQLDNYVLYYDETNKRIKIVDTKLQEVIANISLNEKLMSSTETNIQRTKESIKNFEDQKNKEIQSLTEEIQALNFDLVEYESMLKFYVNVNDIELKQIQKQISEVDNQINNLSVEYNHQIKSLTNSKESKEKELNNKAKELIAEEILQKEKTIAKLNNEWQEFKANINKELNQHKSSIDSNQAKIDINSTNYSNNSKNIKNLDESLQKQDPTCPTCGKKITDKNLKKHLTDELNDLNKLNADIIATNLKLTESNSKIKELVSELQNKGLKGQNEYEIDLVAADGECNERIYEIKERLNSSLEKLSISFDEKMNSIESEFDEKKKEFDEKVTDLRVEEDKLDGLIQEKQKLESQLSLIKSKIEYRTVTLNDKKNWKYSGITLESYIEEKNRLSEEHQDLVTNSISLAEELEILEFWKSGFSSTGIPSLLIDESIPFLNKTVAEYLDKIGGRYVVSFDTVSATKAGEYRDKINVNVLDTQTKANNRKQLSGGQTRVIDIAILLSLCDLQNNVQDMKTNILLLDEIFDSLDDQNIGYISNLLRTLVKGKAINIISHRHIDSIEADEVMRLF